jgi:tetratricopeptide (TPR) repeat protein
MSDDRNLFEMFGIPPPHPFSLNMPLHVTESHNELRLIFIHHLAKVGFTKVTSTRDGMEALASLREAPCEIAIMARDLEKVGGLDLARELAESTGLHRPANILVTTPPGRSEIMHALEAGIDDFLIKPVVQGDILLKIKSAHKAFNNPKNPERVYELAKTLLRSRDIDKAYAVYEKLGRLNDKAARPHVGKAKVLNERNQDESALQELALGIQKNPNYVHAYELRGHIYLKQGQKDKALGDLTKAITISPLNVARYDSCCKLMLDLGNIDGCISILELAVKQGVDDPFVSERLGHCYFLKKEYSAALRYLREAVRQDPENVSYMNSLAICYRDDKDFDKAIDTYNRIIKKDPSNQQVLFNKALTLKHMKKIDEAEKLLHRVLEMDPANTKAKEQLAQLADLKKAG